MTEDLELEQRKRLVRLIRDVAREEAWSAIEEHFDACVGKQKTIKERVEP
jgi:hypothetical protein